MAKGENLEKPKKKGGMVIVIGMGAKPKDMKKSYGRGSDDAKLAGRAKTLRRFRSGRNDIDEILDKRKIDPDEFHGEFFRRHNMSFEDYLESGKTDVDIQDMIDEMAERAHSQRREQGREESSQSRRAEAIRNGLLDTQRFRGALTSNGIAENTWLRHVRSIPDNELTDNTFNDLMSQLRGRDGGMEFDDSNAAYRDRDERRGYAIREKSFDANDEDADEMFNRLTRIFETRGYANPMQAAFESMQGLPQGGDLGAVDLNTKEPEEEKTHMRGSVRNEPSTEFTVPFAGGGQMADRDLVGRHSPRGSVEAQFYGFRGPSPISTRANKRPIEDEEVDMDAVEANMYRASSDSTNVMDEAWALLKGNPSMRDAEGRAINHPAAMVYDDLAHQVYMNEIGPTDRIDDPDDETAADRMEQMRNLTHQGKLVRRLKQGKTVSPFDVRMATRNDRAEQNRLRRMREDARRQTRHTMEFGNLPTTPSPNYGMQSQREADTDVQMKPGNIMDHM